MANPLSNIELPVQLLFSFGLGHAAGPALEPYAQSLANEAWASHAVLPPPGVLLAEGVAQGQVSHDDAYSWAKQQGWDTAQMDAMVSIANVGPGAAYAFELWRRGLIDKGGFDTALKRLGLEDRWVSGMEGLHDVLLSSAELAMAQQQGFVSLDRSNSEASLQGVTNERQQIRFQMAGLPPGVETALQMWRRGIIDQGTFDQIVREGHTKTKYTGALEQLKRQLLSPATAVRAHLKGHIGADEMHSRGQDFGYTPDDMDLWYQSEGRPATTHQIHIGYARGADVQGKSERQAVDDAVAQSDIRPEYADVLWAQRYTYPSAFVLRSLAQSGVLGGEQAVEAILLEMGWKPDLAQKVAAAWTSGGGGTTGDTHVAKAQTQLWSALHSSYVKDRTDDTTATTVLGTLGVAAGSIPSVLELWQAEREIIRGGLSAAQIKKAYQETAFTQAEAVARLVDLGWSVADATTYLPL